MNFEKRIMSIKELRQYGFPKSYLRRIYGTKGQDCAFKSDPMRENSMILFDTEKLAAWVARDIETQGKGLRRT